MAKRKIDVCLTPDLLHLYEFKDRIVVVVDILRATSCMTTAFAHGVKEIIPVAELEECRKLKEQGFIAAAERNGSKVEGFELDNSPFSYMNPKLKGKSIAVTTTNGTLAISKSKESVAVVIGSFLNISALANFLKSQPQNVLILCAGWKGKFNLEDSLFAGALTEALKDDFDSECDSPLAAQYLYNYVKTDIVNFLQKSSHVKRLKRLGIEKDIEFCLTSDQYEVIPFLKGDKLIKMESNFTYNQVGA
jgi:2-phosphosulfolactate phosphatase